MNRKVFIKSLIAGATIAAIPTALIAEEIGVNDILVVAAEQIKQARYAPNGIFVLQNYLKVDVNVYNSLDIKELDELCINFFQAPVKSIGFVDDDFYYNRLTVVPFANNGSNDPRIINLNYTKNG